MNRLNQTLLPLVLTALLTASSFAAEFHVSPDGKDRYPGTREAPFATIQRAADAVQPGDTCIIGSGNMYSSPLDTP